MIGRALGVALGLLADRVLGEPPTSVHPVAWFGRVMGVLEERIWADRRLPGVLYAATGLGLGVTAGRLLGSTPAAVVLAAAGRELRRVALEVAARLDAGDLAGARELLPALVGRDVDDLDERQIAAAVIESVAENAVDAVVAPVFWAWVAGAPGALGHRAVNTMDAMVGHRSPRHRRFGWASARLDDLANYVPARLFATLVALLRPARAGDVVAAVRRQAPAHPSPNAGVAEAAVAAALGRTLGGPLRYRGVPELRPELGGGPRPDASDVRRAVALVDEVEWLLVAASLAVAGVRVVAARGQPRAEASAAASRPARTASTE